MVDELRFDEDTSDAALFEGWVGGSRRAGSLLFDRHFDALHYFLHDKVDGEAALEDLIQQTLLTCIEARARFRGDSTFKTFLLGIARNLLLNHYRSKRQRGTVDPHITSLHDLCTSPTGHCARREHRDVLATALRRIPLEMQLVLSLVYWQELDGPAVASVLGVSLNTAYTRVHRAKRALQAALRELRTHDTASRDDRVDSASPPV